MSDLCEADYGTAFYRSKDPIKNLIIRVYLERVTSATLVPQAVLEQNRDEEGTEMQTLQDQFSGQKDTEEYGFSWQEKVFSKREVDLYSNNENCVTVLDRRYQQETTQYSNKPRPTKRLFSYVEHDAFTNKDENTRLMTTSPNETPTALADKMTNLRHRKTAGTKVRDDSGLMPKLNLIDANPSEEAKKKNHFLSTPVTTMYIMADLSRGNNPNPTEDDEYVLCTVKFDANGVVSIQPDFNKGRRKYRIETAGIGRDVYEYTLEHASHQMSRQEHDREVKMVRQLYNRHTDYLSSLVGSEFEQIPPRNSLRVLIYGEIETGQDFEYDDLYVNYFVDVPPDWYHVGGNLSGITQVCQCKEEGKDTLAYFSFPFGFELLYKEDPYQADKAEGLPKWPMLYFEVLSLDTWERYRTEGYTYCSLPTVPGRQKLSLNCWRPAGTSYVAQLRRFFIGGSPELEDLTYSAVPSTFEGKYLSKFGFRTVSTGTLNVQLNSIHQSQAFRETLSSKKKVGSIMDRLGSASAQVNIMGIIEAFMAAKNRMVSARDNLKKDFVETLKVYHDVDDSD